MAKRVVVEFHAYVNDDFYGTFTTCSGASMEAALHCPERGTITVVAVGRHPMAQSAVVKKWVDGKQVNTTVDVAVYRRYVNSL